MGLHSTYSAPQRPQNAASLEPPITAAATAAHRPRSRGFSIRSKASSNHDVELPEDKGLHTKADPTMAMNEAEPSAVAATGTTSLTPLRSMQFKDALGNPIADPDRSNPTRSRWERPLDTIRGFEAAIDGGYSSRRSIIQPDTNKVRSAYPPRFPQDSYYAGGRANHQRPEHMEAPRMGGYYEGSPHPHNAYGRRPSRNQQQDPRLLQNGRTHLESSVYPLPAHNHRSYETVASGGSAGSSGHEASGYTTDPTSSENSSINRNTSPPKPDQSTHDTGVNGFVTHAAGRQVPYNMAPNSNLAMSQKPGIAAQPRSIQLSSPAPAAAGPAKTPVNDKKKSWLMRRLSKKA